jgi:hypothetical protein
MSTIGRRKATWSNSDGLVVGFGTTKPAVEGANAKNYGGVGGAKVAATTFDWKDVNAAATVAGVINVPVPAGARILNVRVVVGTAWTSTGTNTFEVGDGSDADGFITTTVGTTANMTAGAVLNMDGVYGFGATDTGASELKAYAVADTIDFVSAMVDWTAGTATLVVTYL